MNNNTVLKSNMDIFCKSYEYLDKKKLIEKTNEYIDNGKIFNNKYNNYNVFEEKSF